MADIIAIRRIAFEGNSRLFTAQGIEFSWTSATEVALRLICWPRLSYFDRNSAFCHAVGGTLSQAKIVYGPGDTPFIVNPPVSFVVTFLYRKAFCRRD